MGRTELDGNSELAKPGSDDAGVGDTGAAETGAEPDAFGAVGCGEPV
jgi:hypothetical protein